MALEAIAAVAKPLPTILTTAVSFGNAVSQIAAKRPEEPRKELADHKARWLVCTVKNMTDFPILSLANYMNTGRYDDPPQRVDPFQTMTFTCCETERRYMQDKSFLLGVSGGHSFSVNMDDGNQFFFALGFTNTPAKGCKVSVVEPADDEIEKLQKDDKEGHEAQKKLAEKAYNESDLSGNMIKSHFYKAKGADKKDVVFQFQISASAGRKPVYTITEVRNYLSVVDDA
ncbi:hypothetical protein FRC04_005828 [Tulasnella sp. 424]|nr:hypothetical protein FRC04_005828 [Tulasnella sp. 424]KAG8961583.1 hypothetical protein FRC05_005915 [Tulasnella sp. 425]